MAAAAIIQPSEQPGKVTQTCHLDGGHVFDMKMINLTLKIDDIARGFRQVGDQCIGGERTVGQAYLPQQLLRIFLQYVDRQPALCIVWHDQAVFCHEETVVYYFEHPEATTDKFHRLQVVAQGSFSLVLVTVDEICIDQCLVQAGNMLSFMNAESFFSIDNCGHRGRERRGCSGLFDGWMIYPGYLAQGLVQRKFLRLKLRVHFPKSGQVVIEEAALDGDTMGGGKTLYNNQHFLAQKFVQLLSTHMRYAARHSQRDRKYGVHAQVLLALHQGYFGFLVGIFSELSATDCGA